MVQSVLLDQLLSEVAPTTFSEYGVLGVQFHAGFVGAFTLARGRYTHLAGRHALYGTQFTEQDFTGRKPGEYLNAQGFRLLPKPTHNFAEADNVVALVVHRSRNHEVGDFNGFLGVPIKVHLIARHGSGKRRSV